MGSVSVERKKYRLKRMSRAALIDAYLGLEERFERYVEEVRRLEESRRRHPLAAFVARIIGWRRK